MNAEQGTPETRYAESDGLSIAYQVFGSGAQDLVIIPGIVSHLEADWGDPGHAHMWRRLGQTFRVILFDKRGQGLSDNFEGASTLEQRMDDVRAVMRAAGSERAVLFALSEGGSMGALCSRQPIPGWWTSWCCAARWCGSRGRRTFHTIQRWRSICMP